MDKVREDMFGAVLSTRSSRLLGQGYWWQGRHGTHERGGLTLLILIRHHGGGRLCVAGADGLSAGGRLRLRVDYSKFWANFGGGFGSRLRPLSMPACVLSTPEVPACRVQTSISGFANDENAHVVSVDVDVAG